MKKYILGDATNQVFEYNLSTAYDLSTATYSGIAFSTGGQESAPVGMFVTPDSSGMYLIGETHNTIFQYSLIAAYAGTARISIG